MSISISNDAIQSLFERHRKLSMSTQASLQLEADAAANDDDDDQHLNGKLNDDRNDANYNEGGHSVDADPFTGQPDMRRQSTAASARSMSVTQPLESFDGVADAEGVQDGEDNTEGTAKNGSPAAFSLMRLDSRAQTGHEVETGDVEAGGDTPTVYREESANGSNLAGEKKLVDNFPRSASMWNGHNGSSTPTSATRSLSMVPASTGRQPTISQLLQESPRHQAVEKSDFGSATPTTTPVSIRAPPNTAARANGEHVGIGAGSAAKTPPSFAWREAEDREVEEVAVNRVLLPEAAEAIAAAHAATDAAAPFPFQADAYPFPLSEEVEQYAIGGNRSEALSFPLVAPARCITAPLLRQELERLLSLVSRGHPFSDDAVVVKSRHEVEEDCRAYDASLLLASATDSASLTSPPAVEVAEAADFLQAYLPKADTQRADRVSVIREFQKRQVAHTSASQQSHRVPGEVTDSEGNADSGDISAMVLLQISRYHSMLDGLLERLFFPWRHAPNTTHTPGIMADSDFGDESGAALAEPASDASQRFEEHPMPPIDSEGSDAPETAAEDFNSLHVSNATWQATQPAASTDSDIERRFSGTRANSLGRSGRFALDVTPGSNISQRDRVDKSTSAQSPRSFLNQNSSSRAQGRGNFALRSRFGRPANAGSPARALNEAVRPVADTARYEGWSTVRADSPARSENHSAQQATKLPDWEWLGKHSNSATGFDRGVALSQHKPPDLPTEGTRANAHEREQINRQGTRQQVAKKSSLRYGMAGPRGYFELVVRSRNEAVNRNVQFPARFRHLHSDPQRAEGSQGSPVEHDEAALYETEMSSPLVRVRGLETLRMEDEVREQEARAAALEAEERHRRRKGSRLDGLPTADSTMVVVGDGTRQSRGPRRRARPQLNIFADHVIPELIVDLNAFYSNEVPVSSAAVRRAMRDLRDVFTKTPHTADSHWPLARAEAARIEEMDRISGYFFRRDDDDDENLSLRSGGASTGNMLSESLVSKLVTILALVRVPQTRDFLLARLRRWWTAKRRLAGHVHLPSATRSRNVHAAQTRVLEDAVALELGNVAQALEDYEKRYDRGASSSRSIGASRETPCFAAQVRGTTENCGKPTEIIDPCEATSAREVSSPFAQRLDVDDARDYNGVQRTTDSPESHDQEPSLGGQNIVEEISTVLSASARGAASSRPALLDPSLEDALQRAKLNLSAEKVGARDVLNGVHASLFLVYQTDCYRIRCICAGSYIQW